MGFEPVATRSESDSQRWCAAQYGVHRKVDVRGNGVCTGRPSASVARVRRYLVWYADGRLGQAVTMPGEQQDDVYVRREPRGGVPLELDTRVAESVAGARRSGGLASGTYNRAAEVCPPGRSTDP